ncbi:MAG: DUF6113 family protein [Actinomycetes bacterium]
MSRPTSRLPVSRLATVGVDLLGMLAGLLTGIAGSFFQAATVTVGDVGLPLGLVVSLLASGLAFGIPGLVRHRRISSALALAAWLVAVIVLSLPRAEGDLVLTAGTMSYAWLFGGTLIGGAAAVWPYGARAALGRDASASAPRRSP